ncbi:MAG: energy-coupled thiamine transporter ThiT [Clostridia bacterium]|nr:energy-coupled thiamine transporter ThiT [Clostridia bacterium]
MKKTKLLAEIAITIALSCVFHFLRIWEMPQGGSVSLAMVPILFISFRRGAKAGITAGAVYGLLSVIFDGTIYHPMSIFLDYIFAFGILGIAGFFKTTVWGMVSGSAVAILGRFFFSLMSGVFLFASYAPEGQSPWIYSIIYNGSYMLPELLIAIAVLVTLYLSAPKLFTKSK